MRTITRPRETTLAAAVESRDLAYSYGDHQALAGLSLDIPSGTIFGLLGPNGSGKSTFLSIVSGLRKQASGSLAVLGSTPGPSVRRGMGFVFQEHALDPLMTVKETLILQGRLLGMRGGVLERRAREALEHVDLAGRSGDHTATLSGGMRRRLEVARATLHRPRLLVLDEATTGLDPESRARVWEVLGALRDTGSTVLFATNDVYEAERYCERVAFLANGRCVASGSPEELKRGLKHDAVRLEWPDFPPSLLAEIELWPGVGRVVYSHPTLHVTVDDARAFVPKVFAEGFSGIKTVRIDESTLEDSFFEIVGRPVSGNGGEEARDPDQGRGGRR